MTGPPMPFTTLPARYYTDPDLFRRELEAFYFERWICAGRAQFISNPGDYFLREVAGESVIVVRDVTRRDVTRAAGGAVNAYYNVCRHRGTRMCTEPQGNCGGRIQCPYHGWSYGLDGQLLGAPHMPSDFRREDYSLHRIHTDVWDGHLFLHLGSAPKPLLGQLGTLPRKFAPWRMQELRFHRRAVYDVRANWKLVILNFNECLHCPLVHPVLNRLTDYLGADNELPGPDYAGGSMGFRGEVQTMSVDGQRRRAYLPGLDEHQRRQVCYYSIYPNLLLSLHPDYMMVHTLWPQAVDRTVIFCEWYFHPQEMARPDFESEDAIQFWDTTNKEDWQLVELAQLGIGSRSYTPGPYSPREELLSGFDQIVRAVTESKQTV
jgi:Rieske 2Fe-2S family protein